MPPLRLPLHRAPILLTHRALPSALSSLLRHPQRCLSLNAPFRLHHALSAASISQPFQTQTRRTYATWRSLADEKMEAIQEQYATARDEFEIAAEETENGTEHAAADREAAAAELAKLKAMFDDAVQGATPEVAGEIRSRAGQRIRELEGAMGGLEESVRGREGGG